MVSTNTHDILKGLDVNCFIPVVFDDTKSGEDLYISINRADGYWLTLNPSDGALSRV